MIKQQGKHLTDKLSLTYQTRLPLPNEDVAALDDIAVLMSSVKHNMYAKYKKGQSLASQKNEALKTHNIPARYFNSVKADLEGSIRSVQSNLKRIVGEYKSRIKKQQARITSLNKRIAKEPCSDAKKALKNQRHQRIRRIGTLVNRMNALEQRIKNNDPQICFGSKKLFSQQHRLKEAGLASFDEWKAAWKSSRNNEFFIVGSKDETSGCQLCQLTTQNDGLFTLKLRVPDALSENHGKYIELRNVSFAYGHEVIQSALNNNTLRKTTGSKELGQALSFRFKRDNKGWRVFCTTALATDPNKASIASGCLGVDINADHLAVALVDRFGNPKGKWTVPCNTYGLSKGQAENVIGDACKSVVEIAIDQGVPISIEDLNFAKKKSSLETERNKRYARMLSGLAYEKIKAGIVSRAYRKNVDVFAVNPAYTSMIGRTNYASKYGYSTHHGAAVAIARRTMNCSEKLPQSQSCLVWDERLGHVTLPTPADVGRHVWSRWGALRRSLTTALVGQNRCQRPPKPDLSNQPRMSVPNGMLDFDQAVPW